MYVLVDSRVFDFRKPPNGNQKKKKKKYINQVVANRE
jgi:hypothetical protein